MLLIVVLVGNTSISVPFPDIVIFFTLIAPFIVAVPLVFVTDRVPVVVKPPAMLCGVLVPAIVILPVQPVVVNVPLLIKFPPKVILFDEERVKVAPLLIVNGAPVLSVLVPFGLIAPVFVINTPPVPEKVANHSFPEFLAVDVLYCRVADAPYVGAALAVAVPSIERVPFTVTFAVVIDFAPLTLRVRLLYVPVATVCAPAAL